MKVVARMGGSDPCEQAFACHSGDFNIGGSMQNKPATARQPIARIAFSAAMLASVAAVPWADSLASGPAYSIDFHHISAGHTTLRNSCFVLNATAGQAAPGYSSGGVYAVLAGFWSAAPVAGQDQLFFDGFEGC